MFAKVILNMRELRNFILESLVAVRHPRPASCLGLFFAEAALGDFGGSVGPPDSSGFTGTKLPEERDPIAST